MIEHLEEKQVKFNHTSKEEARIILENSNYFYKITAFRKNFEKNNKNKYVNLDFKHLQDLATLDMRLRYLVMHMSLDIEHAIKTKILADITNDVKEDGYSIVDSFLKDEQKMLEDYLHAVKKDTHYNYGLYNRYKYKLPVWVFFEIITFGTFVKFIEFYYREKGRPVKYKELNELIRYVKNVRNTAAHSSPILLDITQKGQIHPKKISFPITTFVKRVPGISDGVRKKRLSNRKIHDLTVLLYVHNRYIESEGIKNARYKELENFLLRAKREKKLYAEQDSLQAVYNYFNKIVDYLC